MRAWDDGVRWHLEQAADQGPDWSVDPVLATEVLKQHLRSAHPAEELDYVERLVRLSLRAAERVTQRWILPQSGSLVLDAFPCYEIMVPRPPLVSVTDIEYLDEDGALQTMTGSPAQFAVTAPTGEHARKGFLVPLYNATWPATRRMPGAVTVSFTAGYPVVDNVCEIPDVITHGRLLFIAELYKVRSESVHVTQAHALHTARTLWLDHRVREY